MRALLIRAARRIDRATAIDLTIILGLSAAMLFVYSNDAFSYVGGDLQTDPAPFVRALSYSWNPLKNLGVDQGAASGWLFPLGAFFVGLDLLGVSGGIAAKLWFTLNLAASGVGMYYLMTVVGDSRRAHWLTDGRLVAAIAYLSAPFVVLQLPAASFLVPYAVLPLQLGLFARGLATGSPKYAALLGLTATFVATNPTVTLINYVALGIYFVYYLAVSGAPLTPGFSAAST